MMETRRETRHPALDAALGERHEALGLLSAGRPAGIDPVVRSSKVDAAVRSVTHAHTALATESRRRARIRNWMTALAFAVFLLYLIGKIGGV